MGKVCGGFGSKVYTFLAQQELLEVGEVGHA